MVDLGLSDVDVVDGGASTSISFSRRPRIRSSFRSTRSTSASAVSFWNLDQLGRRLYSETLLRRDFLASRGGNVKALLFVLL